VQLRPVNNPSVKCVGAVLSDQPDASHIFPEQKILLNGSVCNNQLHIWALHRLQSASGIFQAEEAPRLGNLSVSGTAKQC